MMQAKFELYQEIICVWIVIYLREFTAGVSHLKRILYVYNTFNTFVKIDKDLLEQRYDVQSVYLKKPSPTLFQQMWQQTKDIDAVVAWFASWHSLPAFIAARLRGIPRILITGGYDVAHESEINYGLRLGGMPKLISSIVFRLASVALPFSETSYKEAIDNTPLSPDKTRTVLR